MAEASREARVFVANFICDECNRGNMQAQGLVLTVHPPQYVHKCDHCGETRNFPEKYPKVYYRYLEQPPMPWAS